MSDDREKFLKKQVKRYTKRLGAALKANEHKEADNLRQQRGEFVASLVEEFDTYFIIVDGKSDFVSLEEAREHYNDPANKRKVGVANAISGWYQNRQYLRTQVKKYTEMDAEKLKRMVLGDIKKRMASLAKNINKLRAEGGEAPIDFEVADSKQDEDSSFLDGIDMDSLL